MISTCSYSVDIAKILGPLSAIFLSILNSRQLVQGGDYIDLSRDDIYNLSGIDIDKQLSIENNLVNLKILIVKPFRGSSNKNHYLINYSKLNSIDIDNVNVQQSFVELDIMKSKPCKKIDKKTQHLNRLKNSINVDDEVLRQNLCDWIDSVIEKGGYLTVPSIRINIDELNKFTNDLDKKISIIKIATKNCWRDLSWATDKYEKQFNDSGNNFAKYSEIKASSDGLINEAF